MKMFVINAALLGLMALAGGDTVERGPFKKEVVLGGKMTAEVAESIFVPRGESWQTQIKWLATEGSNVSPGDVVARFDNSSQVDKLGTLSSDIQAKYDDLRNKEEEMASSLQETELRLRSARINRDKLALDANIPEGLRSDRDHQEAQLALSKAEQDVEKAEDELKTRKANFKEQLEIIKLDIETKTTEYRRLEEATNAMEVKARTGGVVIYEENRRVNRKVEVGDNVYADQQIMSIPRLETMEVEAFISEIERDLLVPGQKVEMYLDAYPERAYTGEVLTIAQNGEIRRFWGKTAWFRVRISLDQDDIERIRPGMSVRCHVTVAEKDEALLVPLRYVDFDGLQTHVKLASGEKVEVKPIGINAMHLALGLDSPVKEGVELAP